MLAGTVRDIAERLKTLPVRIVSAVIYGSWASRLGQMNFVVSKVGTSSRIMPILDHI